MHTGKSQNVKLPEPIRRIVEARHHDPFEVLGRHVGRRASAWSRLSAQAERVRIPEPESSLTGSKARTCSSGRAIRPKSRSTTV